MELLTEDGDIAKRIHALKPTHIATAYIGLDWHRYVDAAVLESVVLSPTVGSNPKAICQLIKAIGFDRVHFLDHLHAKFYWSPEAAVLGSSNLSNNGLQGSRGLVEAAVAINPAHEAQAHADLKLMHERIEAKARKRYKTEDAKWAQVKDLEKQLERLNRANGKALLRPTEKHITGTPLSVFTYAPQQQHIHIIGWCEELAQDSQKVKQGMLDQSSERIAYALEHYVGVRNHDPLNVDDWVLFWETTADGLEPKPRGAIEWMRIDYVLHDTSKSKIWRKIGYEVYAREPHQMPFALDGAAKKAFRKLLRSGMFDEMYLATDAKGWSLERADAKVEQFLDVLKSIAAST